MNYLVAELTRYKTTSAVVSIFTHITKLKSYSKQSFRELTPNVIRYTHIDLKV